MKTELLVQLFNKTTKEFIDKIATVYPELDLSAYDIIDMDTHEMVTFFMAAVEPHSSRLSSKSPSVHDMEKCEILPGVDLKYMLSVENVPPTTAEAIWKYVHTLMLLGSTIDAPSGTLEGVVRDWSAVLDAQSDDHNPDFLESIHQQAETLFNLIGQLNDDDDVNMFADLDEESNPKASDDNNSTTHETDEPYESDEDSIEGDEEDPFVKIQQSKVGKLAKELANEVPLGEFMDIGPSKTPKEAMRNLLGKDPKRLLGLVKRVSDKVKSKLESGEIKEPELIEEVQDMVLNLQNNKKFKKACRKAGMGDIFEKAMNGEGNPADMSEMLRSVMANKRTQPNATRERLRHKLNQRQETNTERDSPTDEQQPSVEELAQAIDAVGQSASKSKAASNKKKGKRKAT